MNRFLAFVGVGLGLPLGGGLLYALYISEGARLIVVALGAFLLAVLTIMVTILLVNRQWIQSLTGQRTINNYRYPSLPPYPMPQQSPPALPQGQEVMGGVQIWSPVDIQEDDEVVA